MTANILLHKPSRMWTYYPDLLVTPVPRYTSFPTAAEFGEMPSDDYRQALSNVSGAVSLYLHIPFCEKICYYCGCNTGAAGRRHRLESYLDALHREIESGELISLRSQLGQETLEVVVYAHHQAEMADRLLGFWTDKAL